MSNLIILIISFIISVQIANAIVLPYTIGVMGGGAVFAFVVYPIVFIISMIFISYGSLSLYNYFFKKNN
jgi:hypothetical protein